MSNFTFLSQEEIFNEDKKLSVIKTRGAKAATTDFSILLGGLVSNSSNISLTGSLEGRTGYYWTKSDNSYSNPRIVDVGGGRNFSNAYRRDGGARLEYQYGLGEIPTNGVEAQKAEDGLLEVEYGYYPQKATNKEKQEILEKKYQAGSLAKTGNTYTTDSKKYDEYGEPFVPQVNYEYVYDGIRYVRIKANSYYDGGGFVLSNGETYKDGDYVWVEVMPVKWIIDENAHTMVADKLIFAGTRFSGEKNYKEENFEKTDIKKFIDTYISKEIMQSSNTPIIEENKEEKICYEIPQILESIESIANSNVFGEMQYSFANGSKNEISEVEISNIENCDAFRPYIIPITSSVNENGEADMLKVECEEAIVHNSKEAKESGDSGIDTYDKIYNEYKEFLGKDYKIV